MRSRGTMVAGVIAALIVIAGVVVGLWFALRVVYDPQSVYVGLVGWPAAGGSLAEASIEPELGNNGLLLAGVEVFPPGVTLDDVAYRAADLGATHAVRFSVEPVSQRPGIAAGQVFVIGRVTGRVMSFGQTTPGQLVEIQLAEQRAVAQDALSGIGADGARILIQRLMAEIVVTDVVQHWARSDPTSLTDDQQRDANRLIDRKSYAPAMTNAAAGFARQCERSQAALAVERGAAKITCHGEPCAEDYAVDLLPDGRSALVQVERKSCFFFLNQSTVERSALVPERLDLVDLNDGTRRPLDTAKNYYGFASAAPTGDRVLFVENYDRDYALVELRLDGSSRRVLRSFRRPERISFPKLSPDGKHIAMLYRNGREQYRAVAMPAAGGALVELTKEAYHHAWAQLPQGTGGRVTVLAVVVLGAGEDAVQVGDEPLGPPLEHLKLLYPTGGSLDRIGGVEFPVSGFAGTRDYSVYFTSNHDGECRLGVYDIVSREVELTDTRLCIDSAVLVGDGSIVGIVELPAEPGKTELVRLDPVSGVLTRLTDNDVTERTVMAAWGNHVLFEKAPDRFHVDFPLVNACTVAVDSMAAAPVVEIPDAGPEDPAGPDGDPIHVDSVH